MNFSRIRTDISNTGNSSICFRKMYLKKVKKKNEIKTRFLFSECYESSLDAQLGIIFKKILTTKC